MRRLRERVLIYQRADGFGAPGGYGRDAYLPAGETSARVRDESPAEYNAAESAQVRHGIVMDMRPRDLRMDDLLVWRGQAYALTRPPDHYQHDGRMMRVWAARTESRYSIVRGGETDGDDPICRV